MGLDDNKLTYYHAGRFKQLSQFGGKVIEARNLTKKFGDRPIVEHFNYSLKRGDRIGMHLQEQRVHARRGRCAPRAGRAVALCPLRRR